MGEERLTGGRNTRDVVRVADTVRRSRGSGASFAAQLLTMLEAAGYAYAPRFLGRDEQDRDILTYVEGRTTDHPDGRAQGAYARGALMLRELHELTAGHELARGQECVMHGDPGPFNTIFADGVPVAFIDWDSARPGRRLDDFAYLAWTWCIQAEGNVPLPDQAAHLREIRDGYDPTLVAETLIDAIDARQSELIHLETINATNPALTAARQRNAEEAVRWATNDRTLVRQNRKLLLTALR